MSVGTMALGAIVQRTLAVLSWGVLRTARHRTTDGPCPTSPTAIVSKPPRNAGMSFPAVSACARSHSALTPRIATPIDGVTPFGLACQPQMRGTSMQRTTTGWAGRLSRFLKVGAPPAEHKKKFRTNHQSASTWSRKNLATPRQPVRHRLSPMS